MIEPKIRYVSFASDGSRGTKNMLADQKKQIEKLKTFSLIRADQYYAYNSAGLHGTPFYTAHRAVLDQPRGAGYWLWKPFLILQAMNSMDFLDCVLYLDADIDIKVNPRTFINQADRCSVAAFEIQYLNYQYTKRDALILMDADKEPFLSMTQVWAGVLAIRNDTAGRTFVTDWLACCMNRDILMDTPSVLAPEHDGFIAHRHDQSVLSILMKKYNFLPVRNDWSAGFMHPTG